MINGREYEWADIHLNVGGIDITGVRSISYKESQEKELVYGKGRKPRSIQRGSKKYEGSITLTQSEIMTIKNAALSASLLDVQVDIVVAYIPDGLSKMIAVDTLIGCEFTDIENKMSQGDSLMEIELPFIALDFIKTS